MPRRGNPAVCRARASRLCVTFGIPPTTSVADPRWGLPAKERSAAARYCMARTQEAGTAGEVGGGSSAARADEDGASAARGGSNGV